MSFIDFIAAGRLRGRAPGIVAAAALKPGLAVAGISGERLVLARVLLVGEDVIAVDVAPAHRIAREPITSTRRMS